MEQLNLPPQISKASLQDFTSLAAMLDAANEYSKRVSGIYAWRSFDRALVDLERRLKAGEVYVFRNTQDDPTAAIALGEEHEYWGQRSHDGTALYFTKFFKDPVKSNSSDAKQLLAFAVDEAARRHKAVLRCDTTPEQSGIVAYYESLGFQHAGDFVYQPSGIPGVLLEASVRTVAERCRASD